MNSPCDKQLPGKKQDNLCSPSTNFQIQGFIPRALNLSSLLYFLLAYLTFTIKYCVFCSAQKHLRISYILPSVITEQTFYCVLDSVDVLITKGLFQISELRSAIRKNKYLIYDITDVTLCILQKLLTGPPFTKWNGPINFSLFCNSLKVYKAYLYIAKEDFSIATCFHNSDFLCQ